MTSSVGLSSVTTSGTTDALFQLQQQERQQKQAPPPAYHPYQYSSPHPYNYVPQESDNSSQHAYHPSIQHHLQQEQQDQQEKDQDQDPSIDGHAQGRPNTKSPHSRRAVVSVLVNDATDGKSKNREPEGFAFSFNPTYSGHVQTMQPQMEVHMSAMAVSSAPMPLVADRTFSADTAGIVGNSNNVSNEAKVAISSEDRPIGVEMNVHQTTGFMAMPKESPANSGTYDGDTDYRDGAKPPQRSVQSLRVESWSASFSKLAVHLAKHHTWPEPSNPQDRELCDWVDRQREDRHKGALFPDQIQQLDELDFQWSSNRSGPAVCPDAALSTTSIALDGPIRRNPNNNDNIGSDIRAALPRHVNVQTNTGMENQPAVTFWDFALSKLVAYLERSRVWPTDSAPESKWIHDWLVQQQANCRSGSISVAEFKRLDELGIPWEGPLGGVPYRPRLLHMKTTMLTERDCTPTTHQNNSDMDDNESRGNDDDDDDNDSGSDSNCSDDNRDCNGNDDENDGRNGGVDANQDNENDQDMDETTIGGGDSGDSGGDVFSEDEVEWETMYANVAAHLEKHQTWPSSTETDTRALYSWMVKQRDAHLSSTLPVERVSKLNDIGFLWWEDVSNTRARRRTTRISTGTIAKTADNDAKSDGTDKAVKDEIFDKDSNVTNVLANRQGGGHNQYKGMSENIWDANFSKLLAHLREHRVWPSNSDSSSRALYTWANKQRKMQQRKQLTSERFERLDKLGLPWAAVLSGAPFRPHTFVPGFQLVTAKDRADEDDSGDDNEDSGEDDVSGSDDTDNNDDGDENDEEEGDDSDENDDDSDNEDDNDDENDDENEANEDDGVGHNKPYREGPDSCHLVSWHRNYPKLLAYLESTGTWPGTTAEPSLRNWLYAQRRSRRNGYLPRNLQKKLDDLGFEWVEGFAGMPYMPRVHQPSAETPIEIMDENPSEKEEEEEEEEEEDSSHSTIVDSMNRIQTKLASDTGKKVTGSGELEDEEGAFELEGFGGPTMSASRALKCQLAWERQFSNLKAHLEQHRYWPTRKASRDSAILYTWLLRQRLRNRRNLLTAYKRNRLNTLGFPWYGEVKGVPYCPPGKAAPARISVDTVDDPNKDTEADQDERKDSPVQLGSSTNKKVSAYLQRRKDRWDANYEKLSQLLKKTKEWPSSTSPKTRLLYNWVAYQRRSHAYGRLSINETRRLNELGIPWTGELPHSPFRPRSPRFDPSIVPDGDKVKNNAGRYPTRQQRKRGPVVDDDDDDVNVNNDDDGDDNGDDNDNSDNGNDNDNNNGNDNNNDNDGSVGKDTGKKKKSRTEPGKKYLNQSVENWNEKYHILVTYLRTYRVWPDNRSEKSRSIYKWLTLQRTTHRCGKLSNYQTDGLDRLNFNWEGPLAGVPFEGDPSLLARGALTKTIDGTTNTTKKDRGKGGKTVVCGEHTDDANSPDYDKELWDRHYSNILLYLEKHGTWPDESKQYLPLCKWLQHQRVRRQKGQMSSSEIEQLGKIGFMWEIASPRSLSRSAGAGVAGASEVQEADTKAATGESRFKINGMMGRVLGWFGWSGWSSSSESSKKRQSEPCEDDDSAGPRKKPRRG